MTDVSTTPLPPHLYRFRTYGATRALGNDKQEVFELLAGRIRFSRLIDFNDPFEGRPHAVPAFTDPGKQRRAVLKYSFDFYKQQGIPPGKARKQAAAIVRGKSQSELVDLMGEKIIEMCRMDGVYLCCLSDQGALSNPLPWSHYSDSHRGVALHFSTAHAPFSFALSVDYSEVYPEVIVPRNHQDPWEHVQRMFFTKCILWRYEHEFRLMRVIWDMPERNPDAARLLVQWDGAVAIAHRNSVVGVTIGARMPETQRVELLARIEAEFPHLEIWQASLHPTKYEIVSERIR